MKLILTENQYKLLESLIDEATTPMSTKIEKGGFIQVVYNVGDTEKSNTLEVTDVYGTGKFVQGVGKIIVNVGGSLDTIDNTFTILKDGVYKEGEKDANGKVSAPEIVGGTKIMVKNVTGVNISDANKNVVDEILTDLGEEKKSTGDESEEERREKREKRAEREARYSEREKRTLEMLLNDPTFVIGFKAD